MNTWVWIIAGAGLAVFCLILWVTRKMPCKICGGPTEYMESGELYCEKCDLYQ